MSLSYYLLSSENETIQAIQDWQVKQSLSNHRKYIEPLKLFFATGISGCCNNACTNQDGFCEKITPGIIAFFLI